MRSSRYGIALDQKLRPNRHRVAAMSDAISSAKAKLRRPLVFCHGGSPAVLMQGDYHQSRQRAPVLPLGNIALNAAVLRLCKLNGVSQMKVKLLAAALLLGTAGFAHAADAVVDEVVIIDTAYNWSGLYIGAQAGYAWGDAYNTDGSDYSTPDPDGWLGGVYAGYNFQLNNNIVLGADADFVWSGADGDSLFYYPSGLPYPDTFNSHLDVKWTGAARARLGFAMDRFLPYIAGGVAFSKADWTYLESGVATRSESDTWVGWTIGAGGEYAFTDNFIGRVEYRYTDFGSQYFPAVGGFNEVWTDIETNEVRFGIAYKF